VGAEEQGLLGSLYFTRHPTLAADRLVANLNFELGNIWGRTRDVVIHGKGKTSLDALVERAASRQNRSVRDEADPRAGWYYRSDQLSFARIGVPAMWFESGRDYIDKPAGWGERTVSSWIATHYHQPSDELTDAWRFDGMVEDARIAFFVALAVASQDERPSWASGDEFARSR
jgi:Zn-dependent M28 family amino/carboxypeptidase